LLKECFTGVKTLPNHIFKWKQRLLWLKHCMQKKNLFTSMLFFCVEEYI
jgi:hypothetical protein